jgi:Arc/MetJ-type ribon-helix-helix transcriptional regulator
MQITLPPHIQSYIKEQIETGRHETEQDVIVDVFEQVMHDYDAMSDPKVLEAIAQADRGQVHEWNDELRSDIRRQAREDARLGKRIPDDVKY